MAHAVLFGSLTGREIAEFLKTAMEHDGTVHVRPTPTDAETVIYQRSLADHEYVLTVESFADGTPSTIYDGVRTEVAIAGDGRGIRTLSALVAGEFGGLVQVHDHWKAVPGSRPERLPPKARLCLAVFELFGNVGRLPLALNELDGLRRLKAALDDRLAESGPLG